MKRRLVLSTAAVAVAVSGCAAAADTAAPPDTRGVAAATEVSAGADVVEAPNWVELPDNPELPLRLDSRGEQAGPQVYPGVQIHQRQPNGGWKGCTAGPMVTNEAGRVGFLTAGHCDRNPGAEVATMTLDGTPVVVGRYADALDDPVTDQDSAVLWVDNPAHLAPGADRIADRWPVVGALPAEMMEELPPDTQVCIDVSRSGVRCGGLVFAPRFGSLDAFIEVQGGDSGGSMFMVDDAGQAWILGVVSSSADDSVRAAYADAALERLEVGIPD